MRNNDNEHNGEVSINEKICSGHKSEVCIDERFCSGHKVEVSINERLSRVSIDDRL